MKCLLIQEQSSLILIQGGCAWYKCTILLVVKAMRTQLYKFIAVMIWICTTLRTNEKMQVE